MTAVVNGAVERGCGWRKTDGIYFTCGFSSLGMPLEYFLLDPPRPITGLGLTPLGVKAVDFGGVTHVVDWVGSEHYPDVARFLEEARELGISRRIPSSFPFERLTAESKIILVHARAIVHNQMDFFAHASAEHHPIICPKKHPAHPLGADPCCARVWWHDLDIPELAGQEVIEETPFGSYIGYARPGHITPEYEPGMFAVFSLQELQVVRPTPDSKSLSAAKRASGVNVRETED